SRPASKGRDAAWGLSLRVDNALRAMKHAVPSGVRAASDPPVIMTSAAPWRMTSAASPIACAAEAQAVATAEFGPLIWKWIETLPEPALHIRRGTMKGLTRVGPFSIILR